MRNPVNNDAARLNPCLKEHEQSLQCLNKNNFDYDKCQLYFDNYNMCKKFWGKVYRDRKTRGLIPYLPDVEDRAQIKEEYKDKIRF